MHDSCFWCPYCPVSLRRAREGSRGAKPPLPPLRSTYGYNIQMTNASLTVSKQSNFAHMQLFVFPALIYFKEHIPSGLHGLPHATLMGCVHSVKQTVLCNLRYTDIFLRTLYKNCYYIARCVSNILNCCSSTSEHAPSQ